ncbi:MAG: hypothetical protein A4E72_01252 [Syntrophus sp. PtaU1.Bin208]|nr:MAG: hypothetical protein A4E72_01252 [Syntrophus sp. PtaU1.Bin208]
MATALRTACAVMTGNELRPLEFRKIQGLKGVKNVSVKL